MEYLQIQQYIGCRVIQADMSAIGKSTQFGVSTWDSALLELEEGYD